MSNIFIISSFIKLKSIQKYFIFTCILLSLFSFYLFLYNKLESIPSVILSLFCILLILLYLSINKDKDWVKRDIIIFILFFSLAPSLPIFFLATSRIAITRELKDINLVKLDEFFLGNFFPYGQLSLFLDKNEFIGPHTKLGSFINNILQICYFFYYIIPYFTIYVICLSNCIKETIFKYYNKGKISKSNCKNWKNLFFLFSVYNTTMLIVFILNILIPAISPRLYLKKNYKHKLILSGFAKLLNKICKDNNSANSFPSGHVAEPFSIAFSMIVIGYFKIGMFCFFFSCLIFIAILFLRYHYFSDALFGTLIGFFSFIVIYSLFYKNYQTQTINDNIELVEEI